ncbi:MAG: T9SS type A sorting domain-containing protein [bacterium]
MKTKNYYLFTAQLILISLIIFQSKTAAQPDITFHVNDLLAGPAECNWMFDSDDNPNLITDDGSPFTYGVSDDYHNFAYRTFTWVAGTSSGACTNENTLVINDVGGITLKLYNFSLNGFNHFNTINANNNWAIHGQAGDERMYVGGIGEIWDGVNLVLRATNCRLSVSTPYPTAVQMNSIFGAGAFTHDVGSGEAVTGSGWGVIDRANSVDAWENEFDPHNTGQLDFDISTISAVIQGTYGNFDFDIKVKPTLFIENLGFANVIIAKMSKLNSTVDIPGSDVSYNIISSTSGHGGMRTVLANQIMTDPGGSAPSGIDKICTQLYWQLGTTLESFTMNVTFDISDITGISNTANLRILKRTNSSGSWSVHNDFTLVDATHIRANNLSGLGEFAIGSTGENMLPVEMQSFCASLQNNKVILNWATATEVNNYGFEVERSEILSGAKNPNDNIGISHSLSASWETLGFVKGNGNSNSTRQYFFNDNLVLNPDPDLDLVLYRLKQIDIDGNFTYSNEIEIEVGNTPVEFELSQNYPNPFNPTTVISYQLSVNSQVSLKVFDMLGREVVTLVDEFQNAGIHHSTFSILNYSLPSGIYFYSLRAGEFYQTKKMLLIK